MLVDVVFLIASFEVLLLPVPECEEVEDVKFALVLSEGAGPNLTRTI